MKGDTIKGNTMSNSNKDKRASGQLFGALYLRISREKGESMETLQNHREIMTAFCEKHGYIYELYEEVVSGGKQDIEARPQLQRLIDNIEKYEAIFCISLDRLSRNGLVSQQIKQLCIDYDVLIVTPSQLFDLANDADDRMLYDISSVFAAREYEMIAKRSRMNKIAMAKRGEWPSARPPFGYRRNQNTRRLEIYESEAAIVRRIYELHNQGYGAKKIADTLTSEGIQPQKAAAWTLPSVLQILRNKAYMGTVIYRDKKRLRENGRYVYKIVETIETPNAHEPIIPPDVWVFTNRERQARAEHAYLTRAKSPHKTGVTMLSGLIYCGLCGRKMGIKRDRSGYSLRRCDKHKPNSVEVCGNSGITLSTLEDAVMQRLKLHRKELMSELRKLKRSDLTNVKAEYAAKLEQLNNEIVENERSQARLVDAVAAGVLSLDEIKAKRQELVSRRQQLEIKREQLEKEAVNIDVDEHIAQLERVVGYLSGIEKLTPDEQNQVLRLFVKGVFYKRVIPPEIRSLSTKSRARKKFPFSFRIDFY